MISLMETSTLTLKTYPPGDYDANGEWVEGSPTEREIKCSVQPVWRQSNSGLVMKILQEGIEIEDIRVIYTQDTVNTMDLVGKQSADRTIIDGEEYYAYRLRKWIYYGLLVDHTEVFFVRLGANRA